jgi:hypothetical protein
MESVYRVREGTGWSKATPVKTFSLWVHQSRWGSKTGRIGTRACQSWHQFARDESCPFSVTTFQDSSSFESSSASDGQYNSSGLLTEWRRNSLSCSLSYLQRNYSSLSSRTNESNTTCSSSHSVLTGLWKRDRQSASTLKVLEYVSLPNECAIEDKEE